MVTAIFRKKHHQTNATAARSFFVGIHQTLPTDDLRAVADIFVREFGEEKVAKAVV